MDETVKRLDHLLKTGIEFVSSLSESALSEKPSPEKWSIKEILGHLIDSGIINIQRFTEIQFEDEPYKIKCYKQDDLVKANAYQESNIKEITDFWIVLNKRILILMKNQTKTTLSYTIEVSEGEFSDLEFLMRDYVDHFEHHLNQILKHGTQ